MESYLSSVLENEESEIKENLIKEMSRSLTPTPNNLCLNEFDPFASSVPNQVVIENASALEQLSLLDSCNTLLSPQSIPKYTEKQFQAEKTKVIFIFPFPIVRTFLICLGEGRIRQSFL